MFCEVTPRSPYAGDIHPQTVSSVDLQAITANLDAAKSLGIDALILPMPPSPLPDATLDSFDELMRQASSRGVHVLLTLPAASVTADLLGTARFWLSRGVSGFHVVTPPQTSPQDSSAIVQAVRRLTTGAVGGRILLSDLRPDANAHSTIATSPRRTRHGHTASAMHLEGSTGAQLQIDSHWTLPESPSAANLRPLLSQVDPNVILDLQPPTPTSGAAEPYPALANAMAAIALTMRPAALIQTGQDLSLQSANSAPAAWYRQLAALHHGNATLRSGSVTVLDFDAQNALVWVVRPASNARPVAPVVVACNLSSSPLRLSLGTALRGLNLHGFFLRTLLRTDKAMGAQDIGAVTLPPFGVYIGELHR